MTTYKFGL